MLNQEYCSEIESLLIQFQSAINDCKLYRRDKETNNLIRVDVPRCILSGKSQVFYDIVNKAGNITFPVIVIEPSSIDIKKEKFQNKILGQSVHQHRDNFRYRQPTPVGIKLSLHIYTKFFEDMWQLISHILAYMQDYIFVSYRTPTTLKQTEFCEEIRCKATIGGGFSIDYPKTLEENKQMIYHASTSFTIDGYIFEKPIKNPSGVIYQIRNSTYGEGYNIMGYDEDGELDYYVKDGWPSITNVFCNNIDIKENSTIEVKDTIKITGRSFFDKQDTSVLINPIDEEFEIPGYQKVSLNLIKEDMPVVGYKKIIEEDKKDICTLISENELIVDLSDLPKNKKYDIIVYNNLGHKSTKEFKNITFIVL